jgi:hypothetical protein
MGRSGATKAVPVDSVSFINAMRTRSGLLLPMRRFARCCVIRWKPISSDYVQDSAGLGGNIWRAVARSADVPAKNYRAGPKTHGIGGGQEIAVAWKHWQANVLRTIDKFDKVGAGRRTAASYGGT